MSPAVTLHLLLNSFFPIVSLPLKIKESISRLTSRRLHFCDSCWFLSRERRVFFPLLSVLESQSVWPWLSPSLCVWVCMDGRPVAGSQTHKPNPPARQSRTVSHHHVVSSSSLYASRDGENSQAEWRRWLDVYCLLKSHNMYNIQTQKWKQKDTS